MLIKHYYELGGADFEISPRGVRIHADTPQEFSHVYETVKPLVAVVGVAAVVGALAAILRD